MFDAIFDVGGKIPEFWYPLTGGFKKLVVFAQRNGERTQVPFWLNAGESTFVVFLEPVRYLLPLALSNTQLQDLDLVLDDENHPFLIVNKILDVSIALSNGRKRIVSIGGIPTPLGLNNSWAVKFNKNMVWITVTYLIRWLIGTIIRTRPYGLIPAQRFILKPSI